MKNSTTGIITAFLAGAAAGALLGILYAPEKGSVTRARLKTLGKELGDDLADVMETLKNEFSEEEEPVKKAGRRKN